MTEIIRDYGQTDLRFDAGLARAERAVYTAIYESGEKPITPMQIYKRLFPSLEKPDKTTASEYVWSTIRRIRKKFGFESIITGEEGYLSRRAVIESAVSKNFTSLGYLSPSVQWTR